MSASPRRLQFVVGTSLLGASLSLGCASKAEPEPEPPHVNTAKQGEGATPTNTAPVEDPATPDEPAPTDTAAPSDPQTPEPTPDDAKAPDATVNVRYADPQPEPKRVNTRPNDV